MYRSHSMAIPLYPKFQAFFRQYKPPMLIEQRLIVRPVVGIDPGDVAHTVGILEFGAPPSRRPNKP